MKPIDEDDVCFHGHEQAAQRASRLRRESSAVTALSAAERNSSRSSAATIRAHAAQRGRFKRCCLRSGCF